MAELTELEKRRILRERRAAKFKQGGASERLNKITGANNSTLSTSSPIDSQPSNTTTTSTTTSSFSNPTQTDVNSKRISQSFVHDHRDTTEVVDENADPEIEDISTFAPLTTPVPDPLSPLISQQELPNDQDLEKLLQQMLREASSLPHMGQGDLDGNPLDGTNPFANDEFFKTMMKMTQPTQQQGQTIGGPTSASSEQVQEVLLRFKRFQMGFTVFRATLIISLLLKAYISEGLTSSRIEMIYMNPWASSFNKYFLVLELIFFLIHFLYIRTFEFYPKEGFLNSIIPLVAPFFPPSIAVFVNSIPSYLDIFKNFQFDISLVIVFYGMVSIL